MAPETHVQIQEISNQNRLRLRNVVISMTLSLIIILCVVGFLFSKVFSTATEIQHQRYENCVAQNQRHDNSLNYIEMLARAQAQAKPNKKKELTKAIAEYKILFQALAPKQNCDKIQP